MLHKNIKLIKILTAYVVPASDYVIEKKATNFINFATKKRYSFNYVRKFYIILKPKPNTKCINLKTLRRFFNNHNIFIFKYHLGKGR